MRILHISATLLALILAVACLLTNDNGTMQLASIASLILTAVLQIMFIGHSGTSRLTGFGLQSTGFALLILQCGVFCISLLTKHPFFSVLCLLILLLTLPARIKQKTKKRRKDNDPDGTGFTTTMIKMMDTISRATAERACGIDTQMLYEQVRFCEPCLNSDARDLEREIMLAVTKFHPDDSDAEITQKCNDVLRMLEKRRRFFNKADE